MKNYLLIISCALLLLFSCKKKEILESPVVKIPSIALLGDPVSSTSISAGGGSYTDPGAVVTDESAGEPITLTVPTENDIDFTTPGLYSAKYVYKTKYGYILTATRLVLVTSVSPTSDISGVYARTSNGQEVNITKVGTGLYKTDNVGGVAGRPEFIYDVFFGFPNDTTLVLPEQVSDGGIVSAENEAIITTPTSTRIQWVVIGSSFATNLRIFDKVR